MLMSEIGETDLHKYDDSQGSHRHLTPRANWLTLTASWLARTDQTTAAILVSGHKKRGRRSEQQTVNYMPVQDK